MHLMPEFLQLSLVDILDIVLVGLLIYQVYKLIKGTSAVNIFVAIILIYIVWLVVKALHMELLTTILDKVINVSVLALIIVCSSRKSDVFLSNWVPVSRKATATMCWGRCFAGRLPEYPNR